MQAEQRALAEGVTLLGVYHSHPDHPAEPSEHDRKQAMPFFSYVILSIREGELAAWTSWQLDDQAETAEFAEEAVAPLF
jgi:proteasome lid subunit RPN8/RPN11